MKSFVTASGDRLEKNNSGIRNLMITSFIAGKLSHFTSCRQNTNMTSGVARVAEVEGQAGGMGLHQGGKRIRELDGSTLYRQEVLGLLKAPSN